MTVRRSLALTFALLLVLTGAIRSITVIGGLSRTLSDLAHADVRHKTTQVQDYLTQLAEERARKPEAPPLRLDSVEALPRAFSDDGTYHQYTDREGRVLNRSANLGTLRLPAMPRGQQEIDLPLPHLSVSPRVLLGTEPLVLPGRGHVGWVQVAFPLQGNERAIRRLATLEAFSLLIAGAIGLGLGYVFAGKALAPVAAITREVERWSTTARAQRFPALAPPRDEIEQLAATFNHLFDRLESYLEAQRRFVADASHELKSPITAIRGYLQLLARRGAQHPEQAGAWIHAGLEEVERLGRLAGELLELAQLEAAPAAQDRQPVELGALATLLARRYEARGQQVGLELPARPVVVLGEPMRLEQALVNLLDNAQRAVRDHGSITVRVVAEGAAAVLQVVDTGVGIPPAALPHVLERFYRVEQGRDREHGGTGLGLSIVHAIVEAHGGTMAIASGAGTTVTLRWPLAA